MKKTNLVCPLCGEGCYKIGKPDSESGEGLATSCTCNTAPTWTMLVKPLYIPPEKEEEFYKLYPEAWPR